MRVAGIHKVVFITAEEEPINNVIGCIQIIDVAVIVGAIVRRRRGGRCHNRLVSNSKIGTKVM
jgi:hypothetical protein